jgi:hypothetical protein
MDSHGLAPEWTRQRSSPRMASARPSPRTLPPRSTPLAPPQSVPSAPTSCRAPPAPSCSPPPVRPPRPSSPPVRRAPPALRPFADSCVHNPICMPSNATPHTPPPVKRAFHPPFCAFHPPFPAFHAPFLSIPPSSALHRTPPALHSPFSRAHSTHGSPAPNPRHSSIQSFRGLRAQLRHG